MDSARLIALYKQLTESAAPQQGDVDFSNLPEEGVPQSPKLPGDSDFSKPVDPYINSIRSASAQPQEDDLFKRISAQTRKQEEAGNVGMPQSPVISSAPAQSAPKSPTSAPEEVPQSPTLKAPMFQATLDPYGAELNDQALKEAYEAKRQGDLTSALLKSASKLGSGVSGAVSGGRRPDDSIDTSGIEKLAGSRLEEIQGRRVGKKDEVSFDKARTELGDNKALSDPNSSISQMTTSMLKKMGVNVPGGVSAAQLKAGGIDVDRMMNAKELAEQRRMAAQESRENRKLEKEKMYYQKNLDRLKSFGEKATGSPEVKDAEKQISAVSGIKLLVDEAVTKGGQAVSALGPQLAKALGEVGVLTDADVTRYIGNPQVAARVYQTYKKSMEGKLSPQDAENIVRLVNVMGKKAEESRSKAYNLKVKQAQNTLKNEGLEPDFIKEAIDPFGYAGGSKTQESGQPSTVRVAAPNGQVKIIPRDKLQDALKAGGKLVE